MADEPVDKKPVNPVSFLSFGNQDLPAFVEVKGKNWIYYGETNDYPYYLIDLYTQSAYHKAIIDGKVSYICSNGWGVDTKGMSLAERAAAEKLLEQPFAELNLTEATYRWVKDAEIFNGVAILVTWSKDKKFGTLQYVEMANLRTNADESEFYYTANWFKLSRQGKRTINNKPEESADWKVYGKYDPKNRVGQQIYYWKDHHPDQKVYPLPVYSGAVTWINIDVSLASYFYNTVENAFVATHLINFFNGEPTEEKKAAIEKAFTEKWTGPKGKRIVFNFAQNKDSAAAIETLQMTDADKQYEAVRKYSEQAIVTGHLATSGMLFGIYREGSLGGRSELMFAEEQFQNNYINGRQKIIENIINELARDFGINTTFHLNKVSKVGYMFSDAIIEKYVTAEDVRSFLLSKGIIKETLRSFSSEQPKDETIAIFSGVSHDGSKYRVLSEREVSCFSREEIEASEHEFLKIHFEAQIKANGLERKIIDLLSKDGTLQPDALAKATDSSEDTVKAALERLVERKILSPRRETANNEPMRGWDVTEKGAQALEQKPAKTARTAVVYRYGLAPRFKDQDEVIATTRDFCREMVAMSKSGRRWKSEAIFSLDPGDGINPWLQRGGWYTKPGTNIHVPQCRHVWIQELVEVLE